MQNYTLCQAFANAQYTGPLENVRILNISADANSRAITAEAVSDTIFEYSEVEKFIKLVKDSYRLGDFTLNLSFNTEKIDENDSVNYCIDAILSQNPFWRAILDRCILNCEQDCVTVFLRHGNLELAEDEGIGKEISALLKKWFGIEKKVAFDVDEMTVEKKLEPIYMEKESSAPKKIVSVASEGALMGKPFPVNDLINISEIDNYTGNCMICGEIFGIDFREIAKIKKSIVSFYITDYTSSVTCKCFVPISATEEVTGALKKTGVVAVRGKAEMDNFSHELTVMARDIIPYELPKEKDDAEEANVKVQVGHVERFNPAYIAARPHIDAPLFVEAHRLAMFNPRGTDVPVVLDLMVHDIDIILDMIKSPIKDVSVSGVSIVSPTSDIANARIEFENGSVANLTASRISLKNMRKHRIFQKDAYITVDFLEKKTEIMRIDDVEKTPNPFAMTIDLADGTTKQIRIDKPEVQPINSIMTELESFHNAIVNGTEPPVTIHDGVKALKVCYMILSKIN